MKGIKLGTNWGAIIACILWSTAFAGIKIGLPYTTPLRFAGIRFFLAGILIIPFAGPIKQYFSQLSTNILKILWVSLLQTSIMYAFFYIGLSKVPAYIGAMIIGGGPIFTGIMAHFSIKHERLTMRMLISMLVGFSGVALIAFSRAKVSSDSSVEMVGVFLLIGANIIGSLANIVVAKDSRKIPPLIFNSAQIGIGGLTLFLISVFIEPTEFSIKPLPYYLSLIYLSILSASAFSIWFILLKRPGVKVSEINVWKFLIPLLGAIISWVVISNEKPDAISSIGMGLIAMGIIILYLRRKEKSISEV